MGRVCTEYRRWVEREVRQPITRTRQEQERRCRNEPCNWWMLCLNKLVCWFVWIVVTFVEWVIIIVGEWVVYVVCEVVNVLLDVVAFIVNLVFSIPILGGILRTVWNWLTEVVWRIVGIFDFIASLLGFRPRKKMYLGLMIPRQNGRPITTEAAMRPQIEAMQREYSRLCNINVIYTGACEAGSDAPDSLLAIGCDAGGFFSDWWLAGSYNEFWMASCKFRDGFRRLVGHGAELVLIPILTVNPGNTAGCSFGSTHNYVVIERDTGVLNLTAHECGHSCDLLHRADPANLMNRNVPGAAPTLTGWQISVIRWSKHCVYV